MTRLWDRFWVIIRLFTYLDVLYWMQEKYRMVILFSKNRWK